MINVPLARKKSKIEHRSSNISHPSENVACTQPSVSHEEDEIQNSNFEYGSSELQERFLKRMIENKQQKELKNEPENEAQSWAQEEQIEKPTQKPWEEKKDDEAIFRSLYLLEQDGEEHYDMIYMEIEADRAVGRTTDHKEIVKQYQKVVSDRILTYGTLLDVLW